MRHDMNDRDTALASVNSVSSIVARSANRRLTAPALLSQTASWRGDRAGDMSVRRLVTDAVQSGAPLLADVWYDVWHAKTTVYLPDELKRALAELAVRKGRSEAELVREALFALTASEGRRPAAAVVRSGRPSLAEHVDEHLKGFGRR